MSGGAQSPHSWHISLCLTRAKDYVGPTHAKTLKMLRKVKGHLLNWQRKTRLEYSLFSSTFFEFHVNVAFILLF